MAPPPLHAPCAHRWQLLLLSLLVVSSKSLSDAPVAISDLCHPSSPLTVGWPALCPASLISLERDLLQLIDFRTTVDAAEFARVTSRDNLGGS